jgi:hypothetical protein
MAEAADKNIAAGTMKGMILVNPDAYTIYNGSMYSSSVTIGDWESFIADDLVSYVDSHYRTIANRDSRGLGGHSMGGYGTIRIGMKRPDVFSIMYIMSACCLMNNPRPPAAAGQGARGAAPTAAPAVAGAAAIPAAPAPATATATNPTPATPPAAGQRGAAPAGAAAAPGAGNRGGAGRGNGFANTASAEAAAWSANPNNAPKFFDEPVKDGQLQPLVVAKWLANSPSVITSKPANDNHLKTGQRATTFRTGVFTPSREDPASAFSFASSSVRISKRVRDAGADRALR